MDNQSKNKSLEQMQTEIYNISTVNSSLYSANKTNDIENLTAKISNDWKLIEDKYPKELVVDYLKSQILLIKEFILDGIELATTKELNTNTLDELIWVIKKAVIVQDKFNHKLSDLGGQRDLDNETEIYRTYNFDSNKETKYLPKAAEIKEKILSETGYKHNELIKNTDVKNTKRGRPKIEIEPFEDYICKKWNPQGKIQFTGWVKKEFKEYKEEYNAGKKQNLNLLAHALLDLEITKTTTEKSYLTSILRLILETKKEFKASEINNFSKLNGYQEKPEYIIIVNKIKGRFNFMKSYEI